MCSCSAVHNVLKITFLTCELEFTIDILIVAMAENFSAECASE